MKYILYLIILLILVSCKTAAYKEKEKQCGYPIIINQGMWDTDLAVSSAKHYCESFEKRCPGLIVITSRLTASVTCVNNLQDSDAKQ